MRFTLLMFLVCLFALPMPVRAQGIYDSEAIKNFYDARQREFIWQDGSGLTSEAEMLLEALRASWKHGLSPKTYHVDIIELAAESEEPDRRAQLEIMLADAYIRYFRDMSGMRVNARDLGLDASDWLQPYSAAEALKALGEAPSIKKLLEDIEPKNQTYVQLQKELVRLLDGPEEPYLNVLPIDFGGKMLRAGERHKNVPALRLRLDVSAQTTDESLYDDRLAAAVMKFQQASGLPSDALIGPTTLKLLNRSNRDKIYQIVANLERLRWVPEEKPERFVMVNIPAATAWAIEGSKVALQMPVVVGRIGRETPSFIADINGVRFNPGWTVPPTIKREDILPQLQENPDYLTDKGMELVQSTSEGQIKIDPLSVNWKKISNADLNSLDMVQIPGAHNPLGSIRILMPNKYNVYLHDTNHRELFDRTQRAQSSGCVRLKDPQAMAAFVLKGTKYENPDAIKAAVSVGKTKDIIIDHVVPVYLLYYTAWSGTDGEIIFGNDIYGMDDRLIKALRAIDGVDLPVHNKSSSP